MPLSLGRPALARRVVRRLHTLTGLCRMGRLRRQRTIGTNRRRGGSSCMDSFHEEAFAIRPSLGGTSFPKPRGITRVKIIQRPVSSCTRLPRSQTVSVASRFAPIVECLKHQPELEFIDEAYDLTLESSDETSTLSTDLRVVGSNQSEQSSDKLAAPDEVNSHLDGERQTAAWPKPQSQPTQTELNQSGRAILVSAPVTANDGREIQVCQGAPLSKEPS